MTEQKTLTLYEKDGSEVHVPVTKQELDQLDCLRRQVFKDLAGTGDVKDARMKPTGSSLTSSPHLAKYGRMLSQLHARA